MSDVYGWDRMALTLRRSCSVRPCHQRSDTESPRKQFIDDRIKCRISFVEGDEGRQGTIEGVQYFEGRFHVQRMSDG